LKKRSRGEESFAHQRGRRYRRHPCRSGNEPAAFNGIFMIARTPGLVAHVIEEQTREKPMRRIDPSITATTARRREVCPYVRFLDATC
jgi:Citrate synthase